MTGVYMVLLTPSNIGITSVSKTIYASVIWKLCYTDMCNT
jgi:hypothetical protein